MWIKKLKLINFQKHESLEINLEKNINLITGESSSGKSCLIRAIRWVIFNDISSNAVRKEGSKETKVSVILNNDIEITRIKSNSKNCYIINKNGNKKVFNSVRRTIPEEIEKIFKTNTLTIDGIDLNLNVESQFDEPFLIGKNFSSSFRAKLFNKLTGCDFQDLLFKKLNINSRNINKEIKSQEESLNKLNDQKSFLDNNVLEKEKIYAVNRQKLKNIQKLWEKFDKYSTINKRYKNLINIKSLVNKDLDKISILKPSYFTNLEQRICKLDCLIKLQKRQNKAFLIKKDSEVDLSKNVAKKVNFGSLNDKISKLDKLINIEKKKKNIAKLRGETAGEIADILEEWKKRHIEYSEILNELKLCSECPFK